MQLHLFGALTPTGEAFRQLFFSSHSTYSLFAYSRRDPSLLEVDFHDPRAFTPGGESGAPSLWISFGPIWLFASFLDQLSLEHPERLKNLRGVIACSSSSAITKRFAANRFDRELVSRLTASEDQLRSTCRRLALSCCILRPTLIYGRLGAFSDRNISRLIVLMRRMPFLPLPAHTGMRQPIHASQLAAVVLELLCHFTSGSSEPSLPELISLGGDSELSYTAMLRAIQQSLPLGDSACRCRLISVPNRLFFAAAAPLLLHSPKAFEAVLRMGSDLSGFIPAHKLLKTNPQPFPVLPLL